MSDELDWGSVPTEESITKEEIENAESGNKYPVGKYLVEVISSKPKQKNPKDEQGNPKPSYFVAGLKMKIQTAVELNGKPATDEESEKLEGKFLFDDISLPYEGESEFLKSRRIMVARRAGIISPSSTIIPKDCWSKMIIGKQFLVDYLDDFNKKTLKTYRKIAFDGYHAPEEAVKVTADDMADI